MKKLVTLLLIAAMLFTQVGVMAAPGDEGSEPIKSIKVLAIGNSFSTDSMQWLYDVLKDMGVEEVILGNLYIAGCTLQTHAENAAANAEKYTYYKCSKDTEGTWQTIEGAKSMEYGLQDEAWDYISLQQGSAESGYPSSYQPYLADLIKYVKSYNSTAKLMWNMTWAYQGNSTHSSFPKYATNQDVMYSAILNSVEKNIVNNPDIDIIIPCGTAVQNMRTSAIGDTLTRDGYHMNLMYGRYLLGVMWGRVLTGSALDCLSTLPNEGKDFSPLMLECIKEAVNNAYEKPFEVTNSSNKAEGDTTDYASRIKSSFIDVTDQGVYDEEAGAFLFNRNNVVARNGKDIAYLGTQTASLDGQPCAYIDGRFYVPQTFIDYIEGKKEVTPAELEIFVTDLEVIKEESAWKGVLSITNYLTGLDSTGTVKFTAPENLSICGEEIEIKTTDGLVASISFDIPELEKNKNYYDFAFDYTVNGKTYSCNMTEEITFAKKAESIVIDGVMADGEWDDNYAIFCGDQSQAANFTSWNGEADLSANTYISWDEENLYFATLTEDDNFTGPQKPNLPWGGDSMQIAFYHDQEDDKFVPGTAGIGFHAIAISLVEGESYLYKSKAQTSATKSGIIESAVTAVVNNGTKTVYEFSVPWKVLFGYDYIPEEGDILAFSILYNDNDGTGGRRGWLEYAGGINGVQDVNSFAQLYLVNANEEAPDEISVYVNGGKLTFDQAPIIMNDRTLVPLRAIFEALGAEVSWDDTAKTALAVKDDVKLSVKIGDSVMKANDKEIILDAPAQLVNSRTLVPLRAIAEAFGCNVEWDGETRTVTITQ